MGDVFAKDFHPAGGGTNETKRHADRRGLPSAVRSQKSENLAALDF
jgi:hypothetical protein